MLGIFIVCTVSAATRRFRAHITGLLLRKEVQFSYYDKQTLLFTIYPTCDKFLNSNPD